VHPSLVVSTPRLAGQPSVVNFSIYRNSHLLFVLALSHWATSTTLQVDLNTQEVRRSLFHMSNLGPNIAWTALADHFVNTAILCSHQRLFPPNNLTHHLGRGWLLCLLTHSHLDSNHELAWFFCCRTLCSSSQSNGKISSNFFNPSRHFWHFFIAKILSCLDSGTSASLALLALWAPSELIDSSSWANFRCCRNSVRTILFTRIALFPHTSLFIRMTLFPRTYYSPVRTIHPYSIVYLYGCIAPYLKCYHHTG